MNILIYSWRDPKHPKSGGAEQVIHEHAKGWIKAGHKVTLFSSMFLRAPVQENIDGVDIVRKGSQYHLGVQLAGIIYYLKNKSKFDLVIDQFHGMPFFTPLYVHKPIIAIIQEAAKEVWFLNPFPRPINWIYGMIGFLLEPLVFHLYRNITFITGSISTKNDLIDFGISGKYIHIVPHGVLVPKFVKKYSKEKISTIMYLGAITKDKGIEDAIECFKYLSEGSNYRFWICGRPDTDEYDSKIKYMIKNKNLDKIIKLYGFISETKKFELLARAHILINPSIREGWGLVNIEANVMGTPVVAYNSPGLVDSVNDGESGITCSQNSPESMAEEVKRLLKDNEQYTKLEEGAKRWAGKFDWVKSKKQSLKIIESIK